MYGEKKGKAENNSLLVPSTTSEFKTGSQPMDQSILDCCLHTMDGITWHMDEVNHVMGTGTETQPSSILCLQGVLCLQPALGFHHQAASASMMNSWGKAPRIDADYCIVLQCHLCGTMSQLVHHIIPTLS
uniref:Uncharacterized protein n=1 Tax=Micrurus carvalhoi TaxID=3147026 RepID=A0A2H6N4I4_9SAUR